MFRTAKLIAYIFLIAFSGVVAAAPVALTPSTHIDVSTGYGEDLGNTVGVTEQGIFDFNIEGGSNVTIDLFNADGYSNLHLFNDEGVLLGRDVAISDNKTLFTMLSTGAYYAAVTVWGREPNNTIGGGKPIIEWVEDGFTGNSSDLISYDISITVDPKAPVIPIPAAAWLLLSGIASLGVFGRRFTKQ